MSAEGINSKFQDNMLRIVGIIDAIINRILVYNVPACFTWNWTPEFFTTDVLAISSRDFPAKLVWNFQLAVLQPAVPRDGVNCWISQISSTLTASKKASQVAASGLRLSAQPGKLHASCGTCNWCLLHPWAIHSRQV